MIPPLRFALIPAPSSLYRYLFSPLPPPNYHACDVGVTESSSTIGPRVWGLAHLLARVSYGRMREVFLKKPSALRMALWLVSSFLENFQAAPSAGSGIVLCTTNGFQLEFTRDHTLLFGELSRRLDSCRCMLWVRSILRF